MALSQEILSQFAKLVTKNNKIDVESTVYGTVIVDSAGNKYVKLDGSDQITPLNDDNRPAADSTTANAKEGERVSVLIKNHTATITGNVSSPAARTGDVEELGDQVTKIQEFDILIGEQIQAQEGYIQKLQTDKASVAELQAAEAKITELETKKASIEELNAVKADITDLQVDKLDAEVANITFATIENLDAANAKVTQLEATNAEITNKLTAAEAEIDNLEVSKMNAEVANAKFATIENLDAANAQITELEVEKASIEELNAAKADIDNLEANKLSAKDAEILYANIDFANINMAAVEKLFTTSGLIKDLVVSDQHISGELVGVTIKGDLIEANTLKADKLVVKGSDGIFYKLNFEAGNFVDGETVPEDSIHGSVITAKSVTAEKIVVDDLVAFGATIGGFHITESSIFSGAKESVNNGTTGVYMDKDGQFAIGDGFNYLKYYKAADGKYRLEISAGSIILSANNKTIEETISDEVAKIEVGARNLIRNSRNLIFDDYYFSGPFIVTHDNDGNVAVVCGGSATLRGDGKVFLKSSAVATDDGNGNVIMA